MITYQRATEKHIDELSLLRGMVLSEVNKTTDPEEIQAYVDSNLTYLRETIPSGEFIAWIAIDKDKIVATSGIVFYRMAPCKTCPNGKAAYIQNMYTLKEYRRQGLAKELFIRTIEEAKAKGCTKIMLNASDDGKPLYEQFGFINVPDEMEFCF